MQKFGRDFAAWLYFGVEEERSDGPVKLRGCLAPEEANGPDMVILPNHVYMAGLDGYVELCKQFAQGVYKRSCKPTLRGWKEDCESGFRQLPLSSIDQA
eukprot:12399288-Karenia_brevis.AAC.1